jgi:hypothetical protein
VARRIENKNDATMEVSASQLLELPKPPPRHRSVPANDRSVWMQSVVGTDDFAPAVPKRTSTSRAGMVVGVLVLAAIAGSGFAYWRHTQRPSAAPPESASSPTPKTPSVGTSASALPAGSTAPVALPAPQPPTAAPMTGAAPTPAAPAASQPVHASVDAISGAATPTASATATPTATATPAAIAEPPVKKTAAKKTVKKKKRVTRRSSTRR